MLVRYKVVLMILVIITFSWILITDQARIDYGERLAKIEQLDVRIKRLESNFKPIIPEHKKWGGKK